MEIASWQNTSGGLGKGAGRLRFDAITLEAQAPKARCTGRQKFLRRVRVRGLQGADVGRVASRRALPLSCIGRCQISGLLPTRLICSKLRCAIEARRANPSLHEWFVLIHCDFVFET